MKKYNLKVLINLQIQQRYQIKAQRFLKLKTIYPAFVNTVCCSLSDTILKRKMEILLSNITTFPMKICIKIITLRPYIMH